MKLRNKKTGEIIELLAKPSFVKRENDYLQGKINTFNSLAELNEEWEDYEEPKRFYWLDYNGDIYNTEIGTMDRSEIKEIGNLFETKEEAEKAVEKLKAWKRLKDKGIKIIDYECCGGVSKKGEFLGEVKVTIDVPQDVDKYLFETLFGGEE